MNIIYTCITKGKDALIKPLVDEGWEFVCFTDDDTLDGFGIWKIKPLQKVMSEPRRTARWHKLHSHLLFPDADVTVWVDGNIKLLVKPREISKFIEGTFISATSHRFRSCVYEEAKECIRYNLDSKFVINDQMKRYMKESYPRDNSLGETGIVVRKSCPEVIAFNELWWSELSTYSKRDQLSFNYCLWKLGMRWSDLPKSFRKILRHKIMTTGVS